VLSAAFFYLHVTRGKLAKRLSYEKGERKMLMKLTIGCSFVGETDCAKLLVLTNL